MGRRLTIALAMSAYFSASAGSNVLSADEPTVTPQVRAEDLHAGRAKIIGYLGRPLGEVVTVRGYWIAPVETAKVSAPIYRVTHINGKPAKPPIDFTRYRVRPANSGGRAGLKDKDRWDWIASWDGKLKAPDFKAGEAWEYSGVENCSMRVPVAVWEGPIVAVSADVGADGFLDTFDFIRARRISAQRGAVQQAPSRPRAQ